jgi:hypothetical protein
VRLCFYESWGLRLSSSDCIQSIHLVCNLNILLCSGTGQALYQFPQLKTHSSTQGHLSAWVIRVISLGLLELLLGL